MWSCALTSPSATTAPSSANSIRWPRPAPGQGDDFNRENQVTAGQKVASIKFSADLEVSRLILQAFFDEQITRPKVSTSFATTNVKSGIALRFNLTQ